MERNKLEEIRYLTETLKSAKEVKLPPLEKLAILLSVMVYIGGKEGVNVVNMIKETGDELSKKIDEMMREGKV